MVSPAGTKKAAGVVCFSAEEIAQYERDLLAVKAIDDLAD